MRKNLVMIGISLVSLMIVSACGDNNSEQSTNHGTSKTESQDHMHHHSSDNEVPQGLQVAKNPKFAVGSTAIMETDHMEGMNGVEATIVGAYDTTVYSVSYTPTNGGDVVKNHKWVIKEEVQSEDEPITLDSEVVLNANHMAGMNGAIATIDSIEKTTVYMVDYISSSGEKVKNHKWVIESELVKK